MFLGEGAHPSPALPGGAFLLPFTLVGGTYPTAGTSRLPGGTSGSGVWPVGRWPGTWGPAGAQDGRRRGQPRGRGCRSAHRLGAFGPLVPRRQREEGVYLGILEGRGCGGSAPPRCVTPRQHFPNRLPREVGGVLLRRNPWLRRRDQSLRFDGVAQGENGSRARRTPSHGASVCGSERLPVHVGRRGLSKSLLSGPRVPLAGPFHPYSGGRQQRQRLRGEEFGGSGGGSADGRGVAPPPRREDSPSKAGITVLRRASTRPSGEPKRKKPETLKSRRPALMGPSSASAVAAGGQEAVLARRGSPEEEAAVEATCRLRGRGAQCGCLRSPEQAQGRGERAGMSPGLRALGLEAGRVAGGALGGQG